jgi:hypothetical protein
MALLVSLSQYVVILYAVGDEWWPKSNLPLEWHQERKKINQSHRLAFQPKSLGHDFTPQFTS